MNKMSGAEGIEQILGIRENDHDIIVFYAQFHEKRKDVNNIQNNNALVVDILHENCIIILNQNYFKIS